MYMCTYIFIYFLNLTKMILPRYMYINQLHWISKNFKKKQKPEKRRENRDLSSIDKYLAIAFKKCSSRKE